MNYQRTLEELMKEREKIDEAISVFQRLSLGKGKRRGRPPSWQVELRKKTAADSQKK